MVDVWHCDAAGVYSGVSDPGFDTSSQQFLRGYQVTDRSGRAQFTTIYPGWYPGRTIHIHFKVRTNATGGQAYEFTSQLFFDEALNDQVLAQPPYAARGQRNTFNSEDNIYNDLLPVSYTHLDVYKRQRQDTAAIHQLTVCFRSPKGDMRPDDGGRRSPRQSVRRR